MCRQCDARDLAQARRAHVLQLLALVEHPEALPAGAALRLGREIMALLGPQPGSLRCDAVTPGQDANH